MLRSLLLLTAGSAAGWYAHRAFGSLVEPDAARPSAAHGAPDLGRRFAQRAGIDPDTIAQDLGQAAGDAAATALAEGMNRFTERLKTDAPPWVSALATRATVIAGETLDTPSSSAPPARAPRTTASPSTTTISKDPTA